MRYVQKTITNGEILYGYGALRVYDLCKECYEKFRNSQKKIDKIEKKAREEINEIIKEMGLDK